MTKFIPLKTLTYIASRQVDCMERFVVPRGVSIRPVHKHNLAIQHTAGSHSIERFRIRPVHTVFSNAACGRCAPYWAFLDAAGLHRIEQFNPGEYASWMKFLPRVLEPLASILKQRPQCPMGNDILDEYSSG